jgi:hypothetical protein
VGKVVMPHQSSGQSRTSEGAAGDVAEPARESAKNEHVFFFFLLGTASSSF